MDGWIRTYREIFDWEWFDDEKMFKFFVCLTILANHKDGNWHGIPVSRGQFITSREKLSAQLNFSEQQVRTMLLKLQKTGEITTKTTNKFTIVTICNYDKYQPITDTYQPTNEPTNNQQITNKQPTNNQQITTNNNDKNEKNDNNDKNINKGRFTPPTVDEVKAYCLERENNIDPQAFVDFYTSKGWKIGKESMKDWRASVRTWEKRHEQTAPQTKTPQSMKTAYVNQLWQ